MDTHMKYFRLFFVCFLCGNIISLSAQTNNEDVEDPYKELYTLKKEIEKKDAKIEKLELDLAKMKSEKNMTDSLLKVERAMGKSKEMKSQLQLLEIENAKLKKELANCSNQIDEALAKQAKVNLDIITQYQQQHSKDSIEIENLKRNLADLSSFRKMWIAQLAVSVNDKWLNKPYSQINIAELETDLKQYEEFASTDNKIADARDKLKVLLQNCRAYEKGKNLVNSEYNKTSINNIILTIKNLRDKITDRNKKDELSLLYWQLDNYGITIEIFQDVIKAVDEETKDMISHKAAWPLAKAVIDKMEKEDEYITAIKKIPWLSKQYDLYYKTLEKDCKSPNVAHDTIIKLQP